jgi:hypothetical protein
VSVVQEYGRGWRRWIVAVEDVGHDFPATVRRFSKTVTYFMASVTGFPAGSFIVKLALPLCVQISPRPLLAARQSTEGKPGMRMSVWEEGIDCLPSSLDRRVRR